MFSDIKCNRISILLLCLTSGVISSKVRLGVHFESLCPDSRRFVNQQLTPTFALLSDVLDIDLVPFGNSRYTYDPITKDVSFECQHGIQECFGNKIQVILSNHSLFFNFVIFCLNKISNKSIC